MVEAVKIIDGCLIRDQDADFDGARGDSCFDTSAYGLSSFYLTEMPNPYIDPTKFITPTGTVRHPLVKWRENDMSEDNEKPLFMYARAIESPQISNFIHEKIQERGDRTGNGNLITLAYEAELEDLQWLRCLCLVVQVIFFWFPFYWNDGGGWPIGLAWKKSDGYLQWALTSALAPKIFRKLIRKSTLKQKISDYYGPEGVLGNWVVERHQAMIDKLF